MKYIIFCITLLSCGVAFADEEKEKPKESIEEKRTTPPIKSGFLIDTNPSNTDGFFYVGLELLNRKFKSSTVSLDIGVASSRVIVGFGWSCFYDGTIGPFVFTGINLKEMIPSYGIGFTVLKL